MGSSPQIVIKNEGITSAANLGC